MLPTSWQFLRAALSEGSLGSWWRALPWLPDFRATRIPRCLVPSQLGSETSGDWEDGGVRQLVLSSCIEFGSQLVVTPPSLLRRPLQVQGNAVDVRGVSSVPRGAGHPHHRPDGQN